MTEEVVILIAEDDAGHFSLIKKNLWRSCIANEILQFKDGQDILDFLHGKGSEPTRKPSTKYILLLDIRMPKVDGHEVLRQIKNDPELRKIPVIMLTTADEEIEVENCYDLGCSFYIVKPADYNKFMEVVGNLGAFLSLQGISLPTIA